MNIQEKCLNPKLVEKISNELLSFETCFGKLQLIDEKIKFINENHQNFDKNLDDLNNKVIEQLVLLKNMQRIKEYQEKLLTIKKDIVQLNARFGNLKKKSINLLQEKESVKISQTTVEQKKIIEEENITAKFVPPSSNQTDSKKKVSKTKSINQALTE